MSLTVTLVIDTILVGSLYGLFALGLTLIFGVLDVANFAFAAVSMTGGYTAWYLIEHAGLNIAVALILSCVTGALSGAVIYYAALYPIFRRPNAPFFAPLLTTLAANIVLVNLAEVWFGPSVQSFSRLPATSVKIAGQSVGLMTLISIVVGIVLALCLWLVISKTPFGLSVRAVQSNRRMAELMGINVSLTMLWTSVISSVAASAAGALIAVSYDTVSPQSGTTLLFLAFAIVMLGGLGSVPGAMLVSYLLGAVDVVTITLLPDQYQDVITYALMGVAVVCQSHGFFGRRTVTERV